MWRSHWDLARATYTTAQPNRSMMRPSAELSRGHRLLAGGPYCTCDVYTLQTMRSTRLLQACQVMPILAVYHARARQFGRAPPLACACP